MSKIWVSRFNLQPTDSFPEGAPQRENYKDDEDFDAACDEYDEEWLERYECGGCEPESAAAEDCPECSLKY